MKERSYAELKKSSSKKRQNLKDSFVLDLYIDMILLESLLELKKEKLSKQIDQAIDEKNKEQFMRLSKEMIELNKQFGT